MSADIIDYVQKRTTSRKEANVNWNALMSQVDSLSVSPSESIKEGIAENKDALLNASKSCARQNIMRRVYRLALERRITVTSTSVSVGDSGGASIIFLVAVGIVESISTGESLGETTHI